MSSNDVLKISADEARKRGLPGIAIEVDARSASMSAEVVSAKDLYLHLSGPPGGPLLLMIWDCTGCSTDVRAAIQAKFVPTWTRSIAFGQVDRARVMGDEREGMTFTTGEGFARIAWFGFLMERPAGLLLVTLGVGGRDPEPVPAVDVVSNPAIAKLLSSLKID